MQAPLVKIIKTSHPNSPIKGGEGDFGTDHLLGSLLLTSLHSLIFGGKTNIHLSSFDTIMQYNAAAFIFILSIECCVVWLLGQHVASNRGNSGRMSII